VKRAVSLSGVTSFIREQPVTASSIAALAKHVIARCQEDVFMLRAYRLHAADAHEYDCSTLFARYAVN
jgi:CO/xanthine dehydrogenase FAD-binding subunit